MPVVPQTARPRSHKAGSGSGHPKANKRNGKKGGPRPGAGRKPSNSNNTPADGEDNDDGGGNTALDLYEFDGTGAKSDLGVAQLDDAYAETSQDDFSERNSRGRGEDDDGLSSWRNRNDRKRKRNKRS